MTDRINNLAKKFASKDAKQLGEAIEEVKKLADLSPEERKELASLISTIFYRDYTGNEPLKQVVMEADESHSDCDVETDYVAKVKHGIITAANGLVNRLRLQQVTSGFG